MDLVVVIEGKAYPALHVDGQEFHVEGGACPDCEESAPWLLLADRQDWLCCHSCGESYPLVREKDVDTCVKCGRQWGEGSVDYGDGAPTCETCQEKANDRPRSKDDIVDTGLPNDPFEEGRL